LLEGLAIAPGRSATRWSPPLRHAS